MSRNRCSKYFMLISLSCLLGLFLMGCAKEKNTDSVEGTTYTGTAQGYAGEVTVKVTVAKDGTINAIDVNAPDETKEVGGAAAPKIAKAIIADQSLAVDAVAGATITSNAVITATEVALKEAGVDTEALKKK